MLHSNLQNLGVEDKGCSVEWLVKTDPVVHEMFHRKASPTSAINLHVLANQMAIVKCAKLFHSTDLGWRLSMRMTDYRFISWCQYSSCIHVNNSYICFKYRSRILVNNSYIWCHYRSCIHVNNSYICFKYRSRIHVNNSYIWCQYRSCIHVNNSYICFKYRSRIHVNNSYIWCQYRSCINVNNSYFWCQYRSCTHVNNSYTLCQYRSCTLSPTRWHGKHTYLSSLGILGKKRNYFPKR